MGAFSQPAGSSTTRALRAVRPPRYLRCAFAAVAASLVFGGAVANKDGSAAPAAKVGDAQASSVPAPAAVATDGSAAPAAAPASAVATADGSAAPAAARTLAAATVVWAAPAAAPTVVDGSAAPAAAPKAAAATVTWAAPAAAPTAVGGSAAPAPAPKIAAATVAWAAPAAAPTAVDGSAAPAAASKTAAATVDGSAGPVPAPTTAAATIAKEDGSAAPAADDGNGQALGSPKTTAATTSGDVSDDSAAKPTAEGDAIAPHAAGEQPAHSKEDGANKTAVAGADGAAGAHGSADEGGSSSATPTSGSDGDKPKSATKANSTEPIPAVPSALAEPPPITFRSVVTAEQPAPGKLVGLGLPVLPGDQEEEEADGTSMFIAAMVKSFLHEQHLQAGELDCIVNSSKVLGRTVGRLMGEMKELLNESGIHLNAVGAKVADLAGFGGDDSEAPPAEKALEPPAAQAKSADSTATDPGLALFFGDGEGGKHRRLQLLPMLFGNSGLNLSARNLPTMASLAGNGAMSLTMRVGYGLELLTKQTNTMLKECMRQDGLLALEFAGSRMRNLTYLRGTFLAHGADVAQDLADSTIAHDKKNYTRMGEDMGCAMRKVFLSNNTVLPEGVYGNAELANTTAGMLLGFFGEGATMDLQFGNDPSNPLSSAHIDLHACISENMKYFQRAWGTTMFMFGSRAVGANMPSPADPAEDVQVFSMLGVTMMETPRTLEDCGISSEQQDMLMEAVMTLPHSHVHVNLDLAKNYKLRSQEERWKIFQRCVKAWASFQWFDFGRGLGQLLRESALRAYPQKYSVGPGGELRVQLQRGLGRSHFSAAAARACVVVAGTVVLLATATALVRRGAAARGSLVACRRTDMEEVQLLSPMEEA